MYDFTDLVELSRFAGERFDLVQAGGGNTSVKLDDGRLYVKASGMALSDVGRDDFCCVQWQPLLNFLDNGDLAYSMWTLGYDNSQTQSIKSQLDQLENPQQKQSQQSTSQTSGVASFAEMFKHL